MAELLPLLFIILFLLIVTRAMSAAEGGAQKTMCHEKKEPHDWEYKEQVFPNGQKFYYVQCNKCGVRPGQF